MLIGLDYLLPSVHVSPTATTSTSCVSVYEQSSTVSPIILVSCLSSPRTTTPNAYEHQHGTIHPIALVVLLFVGLASVLDERQPGDEWLNIIIIILLLLILLLLLVVVVLLFLRNV